MNYEVTYCTAHLEIDQENSSIKTKKTMVDNSESEYSYRGSEIDVPGTISPSKIGIFMPDRVLQYTPYNYLDGYRFWFLIKVALQVRFHSNYF